MSFEFFVAKRYLLARRKQAFISVISSFSILGVALGVAALIVVIGVMEGFSTDLRDKILGVNSHVILMNLDGGLADIQGTTELAANVPGVTGVTPFIYTETMISTPQGVKGTVLRGLDPATAGQVLDLERDMIQGSLNDLTTAPMGRGLVVGRELADRLGIGVGSRVNLLAPSGKSGAAGFEPTVTPFWIVGVFSTGMFEYDSSLSITSLTAARELLNFGEIEATGLEIRVDDLEKAQEIADKVRESVGGYPFYTRNWMEMNANLFAALKLEKTAMFVILVMIVLVGSFSIVTSLVMLVMEKTRDIAILMSMGATRRMIRTIFMLQGVIIGAVGTFLGFALGLTASLLLEKYQFIKLPKDVYSLDHLPVRLEWFDLTLIGVAAMVLCFIATLYPSRQASRLEPVEALRFE